MEQLEAMERECQAENKAEYYMLLGKALNVQSSYDEKCFQMLNKAVKLNPKLIDGLNQLGIAYWKKGDVSLSINCFEKTLRQDPKDKLALRHLSMLLRQVGGSNDNERMENIVKSYQKAKEALDADVEDGTSWYILGNSLFYLFFLSSQPDESRLRQCKQAYARALKDMKASQLPDLLYNYAHVMEYDLDYQLALEYLTSAKLLDPSWLEPVERRKRLVDYLKNINEMITTKSTLKNRQLTKLLAELQRDVEQVSKCLNPTCSIKNLSELTPGKNLNCAIVGKLIGRVGDDSLITHCFCLVSEQATFAVYIANLNKKKEPLIFQAITILDPELIIEKVNFEEDGLQVKVSFPMIKVDTPLNILVNGKLLGRDCIGHTQVDFSLRSD